MYDAIILELDCGTTIFSNTSGVISLPKNTKNYLATVNCTYTVSANRLSYIWFNSYFTSSAQILNSFENCDTDSLTVGHMHALRIFKTKSN